MKEKFGYENSKINFICNARKIERNENSKIKDYFSNYRGNPVLPVIQVIEYKG